jgi:hypothetical protein
VPAYGRWRSHTPTIDWRACSNLARKRKQACNPLQGSERWPWRDVGAGTINVSGADGRTLKEQWGGEPRAFLGIPVPNFPNFYIMYGPGTNGGEIVSILLRQAEHIVRTVKRMARTGITAVEVKPAWAAVYDAWLQSQMTWTSWAVSNNYYKASTGKIVTQWPFSPGMYGLLVRVLGRPSQSGRRHLGNVGLDVDRSYASASART